MSLPSLEAFLERVQEEPELQALLMEAPDAAAVAALAQAAGFSVTELDLWRATATSPDELPPTPPLEEEEGGSGMEVAAVPAADPPPLGRLPDPWLEEEPLRRFVHQAQGDGELRQALASAPDAAAVASIAQAAGYPISEVDLWLASGVTPDELAANLRPSLEEGSGGQAGRAEGGSAAGGSVGGWVGPADAEAAGDGEGIAAWGEGDPAEGDGAPGELEDDLSPRARAEAAIREFLQQVEADGALRQALAGAPDAAAVASIAQGAGHPISELALWLASGAAFEEIQPAFEPLGSVTTDPLALFLRAVEVDPDLQTVLASAPDAATVAALARVAGFPLTAADLWSASDAVPHELVLEQLMVGGEELVVVLG
jgi:predicted ribosomally synthesized peptide with nif11-like leader